MIPAKANCPATSNKEYIGYPMTEYFGSGDSRYMYECVDKEMNTAVAYQNGISSPAPKELSVPPIRCL